MLESQGSTFQQEAESPEEAKKNLFESNDATFEEWEKIYRTNVAQIYFMTTAFLPFLAHSASSELHAKCLQVLRIEATSSAQ